MTISEYWQSHGYSKEEADRMEEEQVAADIARAEALELELAGLHNVD